MKILHVIHRFVDTSQRGSELYTVALCRHLAGKHEVAVLYTSREVAEGHLERATLGGLTTFVLGAGASWQEAKLQSGSRRAGRCGRYPSTSRARRRASVGARTVMTSSPARRAGAARGEWMDEDKGNLDRKLRLREPLSGGSPAALAPPD